VVPGCPRAGVFLWDNDLAKKRVACYIDGFNLYHAIDDLGPESNYLKWLDLWSLTSAFVITSTEQLNSVYYFSALAYWLKAPKERHKAFVEAVKHFGVTPIMGHFKKKPGCCKKCGAVWTAHEEKQSDVNLATYLIHHSHIDQFDKALVITADSDLCPAIQLILDSHPEKEITILVPPNRYKITRELRGMVTAQRIKQKHLKNNQLPDVIRDETTGAIVASRPKKYFR
jgi:uncharacterized LabA/DUF88 family protein